MTYLEQYTQLKITNNNMKAKLNGIKEKILETAKNTLVGKRIRSKTTGIADTVVSVEGWVNDRKKINLGFKVANNENSPVLYRTSSQYIIWTETFRELQQLLDQINRNDEQLYLLRLQTAREAGVTQEEKIRIEETK